MTEKGKYPIADAHRSISALVKEFAAKYPEAGLSFGYIGNFSMEPGGFDDREWRVFSRMERVEGGTSGSGRRRISWPHTVDTAGLPKFAEVIASNLEEWVREQLGLPKIVVRTPSDDVLDDLILNIGAAKTMDQEVVALTKVVSVLLGQLNEQQKAAVIKLPQMQELIGAADDWAEHQEDDRELEGDDVDDNEQQHGGFRI